MRILRGIIGFAAGLALWVALTPGYNALLARAAQRTIRAFESPDVTMLRLKGREVLVFARDAGPGANRPGIPLYDLTFNIVLLTTLFATNHRWFETRNVVTFLLSMLVLMAGHLFALIAYVQDVYASGLAGPRQYSAMARSFWQHAIYFYRFLGQFALPLILWWTFAAAADPMPKGDKKRA